MGNAMGNFHIGSACTQHGAYHEDSEDADRDGSEFGFEDNSGWIFAVGPFNWYAFPEFRRSFQQLMPAEYRRHLIHVPTALGKNMMPPAQYTQHAEMLAKVLGYEKVTVLDFKTSSRANARNILSRAGRDSCIYLDGGNTFVLRHFARDFDDMIAHAVRYQGVSCIGVSAGALLCGSTVETAVWKGRDNPKDPSLPELDWADPDVAEGLNLLDGNAYFMHYDASWADVVTRGQDNWDYKYPVVTIMDNTMLVYEAGSAKCHAKIKAMTAGPEPLSPTRRSNPPTRAPSLDSLSGLDGKPARSLRSLRNMM